MVSERTRYRDKKFLREHDFNKQEPVQENGEYLTKIGQEARQRIDMFLRSQFERGFALHELVESTGIDVKLGLEYLRSRDDVEAVHIVKGHVKRWFSHVKPFKATSEGKLEVKLLKDQSKDKLGQDARADYFWTQTRGHHKKRRSRRK